MTCSPSPVALSKWARPVEPHPGFGEVKYGLSEQVRILMARFGGRFGARRKKPSPRKRARPTAHKKDPLFVDGKRPRPMYVDYKDVDFLKKLVNRHGRIVGRRKTGCSAASQHAVTAAIKRARFMALLSFTGD